MVTFVSLPGNYTERLPKKNPTILSTEINTITMHGSKINIFSEGVKNEPYPIFFSNIRISKLELHQL